jgi:hypothetical protein
VLGIASAIFRAIDAGPSFEYTDAATMNRIESTFAGKRIMTLKNCPRTTPDSEAKITKLSIASRPLNLS